MRVRQRHLWYYPQKYLLLSKKSWKRLVLCTFNFTSYTKVPVSIVYNVDVIADNRWSCKWSHNAGSRQDPSFAQHPCGAWPVRQRWRGDRLVFRMAQEPESCQLRSTNLQIRTGLQLSVVVYVLSLHFLARWFHHYVSIVAASVQESLERHFEQTGPIPVTPNREFQSKIKVPKPTVFCQIGRSLFLVFLIVTASTVVLLSLPV